VLLRQDVQIGKKVVSRTICFAKFLFVRVKNETKKGEKGGREFQKHFL